MKINLLKITGLSAAIVLLNSPAFSMNPEWEGTGGGLYANSFTGYVQTQKNVAGTVVDENGQPVPGVDRKSVV